MSTIDNINHIKANKIRCKLLLFIDKEIQANKNNKINTDQESLFEISFEESFSHKEMNGVYFSFNPNPKKVYLNEHTIISNQKKVQINPQYDSISTVDSFRHLNSTSEIANSKTFYGIAPTQNKKISNLNKTKTKKNISKKKVSYQSCVLIDFLNSDCDFKLKTIKKTKKTKKDKNFLKNLKKYF